jgi:DNA-binding NtrC family response regulator
MARIAVLDDVKEMGELVQLILERAGHSVRVFTEEEQAIAHVAAERPDAAILDIKLKRMTGVEVLAEMKKAWPGLKVMMLTGYPTLQSARESLQLGAGAYCVKPLDRAQFIATLDDLLARPGEAG